MSCRYCGHNHTGKHQICDRCLTKIAEAMCVRMDDTFMQWLIEDLKSEIENALIDKMMQGTPLTNYERSLASVMD